MQEPRRPGRRSGPVDNFLRRCAPFGTLALHRDERHDMHLLRIDAGRATGRARPQGPDQRPAVLGERGSAPAEFVLTTVALLALVLGVLQVGAALLVRNTALDAVAEGARWSAIVGNSDADGVARARQVLTDSLGPTYASGITASRTVWLDQPATVVSARIPLPVIGLFGPPAVIEVTGHAALEPEP